MFVDTCGQNEFTSVLQNKYFIGNKNNDMIGVRAYILVYSINNLNSFEVVKHINSILLESVGAKYVPRIIVGNFTDQGEDR